MSETSPFSNKSKKLGTFGGVFTPSILTILGVVLFLRLGYVVGNGGLIEALAIILLANAISFFSSYSLIAIATNMRVKSGGSYYIISRTLGAEWGGVIGLVLFFAISISIGFYCIGAAEVISPLIPYSFENSVQWTAVGIALILFIIAWVGADFSTKFQYIVMAVLFFALLSFFAGVFQKADIKILSDSLIPDLNSPGFWYLFAVFFPAITGFTQGLNMSGELEDPKKNIVYGTAWAVGISFVIYLSVALSFAASYRQTDLVTDFLAFQHIAISEELVVAGIIAAAISSALASFLGAPRVLQAMCVDNLWPSLNFFAKGSGNDQNPRRALVFSSAIVGLTIAMGELNLIASIVTVFFLISYGVLNYATFYEAYADSPSFRPTLKSYNKWISFAGVVLCLGAIIAIDPVAGVISFFLVALLFQYLKIKNNGGDVTWADSTRSFNIKRVRDLLFKIEAKEAHPRDWRPHILAFLPDKRDDWDDMLFFASSLTGKTGTVSAVRIFIGKIASIEKENEQKEIQDVIHAAGADAFPLSIFNSSFKDAMSILLQSYGLGPIKANTIIFGWQNDRNNEDKQREYTSMVITALRQKVNLIVLKTEKNSWNNLAKGVVTPSRIDIWWGESKTSQLMLLLAFLTTRSQGWESASIRILAQGNKTHEETTMIGLQNILEESRIKADIEILGEVDTKIIAKHSADASLVFMPMKLFGKTPSDYIGESMDDPLFSIINFALVIASEDVELDVDVDNVENTNDQNE